MASPNVYPNGLGGSTPGGLSSLAEFYCSGTVRYVHSSGSDSYAGTDRVKPLATIQQANTLSAANDIIVIREGHTQTITSQVNFTQAGLTIIGEGLGVSRPTFKRDMTSSFNAAIMLSAAGQYIENIMFTEAPSTATVSSAAGCLGTREVGIAVVNCAFRLGRYDSSGLDIGTFSGGFATNARVDNCSVTSTAASPGLGGPYAAMQIGQGASFSGLLLRNITADGGVSGWANPEAIEVGAGSTVNRLRAINVDLLGDSDFALPTGCTGFIHVRNRTGSARVVWAA